MWPHPHPSSAGAGSWSFREDVAVVVGPGGVTYGHTNDPLLKSEQPRGQKNGTNKPEN